MMNCSSTHYAQLAAQAGNWIANTLNTISHQLVSALNPSWTQLILILAIVFKKNVSELLSRIKKISRNGVYLDHAKQNLPPDTPKNHIFKDDNSTKTLPPTVQKNIEFITAQIQNEASNDNKKAINILKKETAIAYFNLRCEKIYNLIYGSQIALLKLLQDNENKFFNDTEANHYYLNNVKKIHPEFYNDFDLSNYLYFLIQTQLITPQENGYSLSEFGKDFLAWIHYSGYPENKFF